MATWKIGGMTIKAEIYWVSAIDWDIRNFHGYITQRDSTYNAYLIVDEKIVLVDTVKKAFFEKMLLWIKEIVDLAKIDYVVANHVEMDHFRKYRRHFADCLQCQNNYLHSGRKGSALTP